eukprot:jgi/Botrbrau1/15294/Bobra.0371s0004.1
MERGDLAQNIVKGTLTWYKWGRKVAIQVAQGLVFLHSKRILHLDLKSANVMLKADFSAKIGDVGLSKVLLRTHCSRVTAVGTFDYAAPELLMGAMQVSEQADIYSFGVILWEIATGELGKRGQMRNVLCPGDCPEAVRDLINDCLLADPNARPTARDLAARLMSTATRSSTAESPRTPQTLLGSSSRGSERAATQATSPTAALQHWPICGGPWACRTGRQRAVKPHILFDQTKYDGVALYIRGRPDAKS